MKLTTFSYQGNQHVGVLRDDHIALFEFLNLPTSMRGWIEAGSSLLEQVTDLLASHSYTQVALAEARLLAPLTDPGKLVAIGLNYMDHCREQNVPVPDRPIVFTKFTTAIIGPGDPITWDPQLTSQVDYEVELGVVIGKTARKVSEADALGCVYGYTVINDVSARDLQFSDRQWVRAKSLDTFCPMGPVILTADEIDDPQALKLKASVNGNVLQDSSTKEMIFNVRQLISILSHAFTLLPGDVIATGTPDGVGVFRNPQVFLTDGDRVVVEVEKIGQLENFVRL